MKDKLWLFLLLSSCSGSQQSATNDGMLRFVAHSDPGISFVSDPATLPVPQATLPEVTLAWNDPKAKSIQIRMGSASGVLFAAGAGVGTAKTGPWVQSGLKFFLQDTTHGEPGETVSELVVSCDHCKSK